MGVVSYSPDSEESGGNWETVTDSEIIKLLDSMAEQIDGAPDGRYTYYSDNYLKREAEKRTEADEQRDREAFDDMNEAVKDEAGKTGQEGEYNAFLELAPKAVDEHIKFESNSIVPGFLSFVSDVGVSVSLYRIKLPAGVYFLKGGEEITEARVYTLTFDADELIHLGDNLPYDETTDENGMTTRSYKAPDEGMEPLSFSAKLEPIATKDGEYLSYLEYAAWLAIEVAPDKETRDAIFNSAYNVTRKEETDGEEPPKQDGAKPTWRHDPVTKLAQSLSNPALYDEFGTISLDVAGKADRKRKRAVETVVSLEYIGDSEDVKLSRPIDEFDCLVLDGYIAQIAAGRSMFTAADVFEAAIGGANPNENQLREVTESIDRMRANKLTIDMTAEAEAHNLVDPETGKPWKSWKVETMLVPADKITMTSPNGRVVEGYTSTREPVVYTHARMTNQIISYPIALLDTKDAGSNTKKNAIMRNYLLRRIKQAEKNPRMKPTIKYSTIYEKAGIDKSNRTARKRANDYIEGLLKIWTDKGVISGYAIEKEGQQIAKVTVSFPKNPR